VIGTSTTDISLQWSPVACSVVSQVQTSLEYQLNYHLEMQPVGGRVAGWVGLSGAAYRSAWNRCVGQA
jgi:hypothetical protein